MSYAVDGVFVNGSQIELTNGFNWAVAYQHYWNPQWRTAIVGGQVLHLVQRQRRQGMLCGTAPGRSQSSVAAGWRSGSTV